MHKTKMSVEVKRRKIVKSEKLQYWTIQFEQPVSSVVTRLVGTYLKNKSLFHKMRMRISRSTQ